jgi:spore maturation protein SpmA
MMTFFSLCDFENITFSASWPEAAKVLLAIILIIALWIALLRMMERVGADNLLIGSCLTSPFSRCKV